MLGRVLAVSAFLSASAAQAGSADIFAFTDATGVTHFTNVPTSDVYRLVAKGPVDAAPPPSASVGPINWTARGESYARLIDRAAKSARLQPALIRAVIAVESAFNPRAVSRVGAQGLMQLHPDTARRYGVGDAFDPEQNVGAGTRYLRDLLIRYHDNLELALAAYNAGESAVDRHGGQIPPYRETREYVPAVLRLYRIFLTQAA